MAWQVKIPETPPIIETLYTGRMTAAELTHAVTETLAAVRDHGRTRLLADLYFVGEMVQKAGLGSAGLREAVLLPVLPEAADNARFWETTASNRGMVVRLFDDRGKALAWLLS